MGLTSKPLVLITGGTGHIGSCTLAFALTKGYRARVSSRNLASAHKLKDLPSIKPHISDVEFVEVPDLLAPGAFDEAVKNVDYILHLASPIPEPDSPETVDVKKDYVEPAVKGTIGILESAAKSPSVKRVVITSSIVVLAPKEGSTAPIGPDDLAPVPDPERVEPKPWAAYPASKRIAHDAATKFMETKHPKFDLIRIMPAYVQGRNQLVQDKDKLRGGSNDVMMDLILGRKAPAPRFGSTVLVDDVAKMLVLALESEHAKGGENYIAAGSPSGKGIRWEDATEIARELFPEAVKSGILPLGGRQDSVTVDYDVSKSEKAFGFEFADLKTQVKNLVGQYVELASKQDEAA
jgi:nucleoside-diphosphate-sugar epimerase